MSARILVTGAHGFVGRNLMLRLSEAGFDQVTGLGREAAMTDLQDQAAKADVILHLAGANRPEDPAEFVSTNVDLTAAIAQAVAAGGRKPMIFLPSSTKAVDDTPYGRSKKAAEDVLLDLAASGQARVHVQRMPNVFGKWARPNYNSAVATFCHNTVQGLPIEIHDPDAPLTLLYVDDLIDGLLALIAEPPGESGFVTLGQYHQTTVGAVADMIAGFSADRAEAMIDAVGSGLTRALYATYISYLPVERFSYPLKAHADARGSFTEFAKTRTHGQVSYLTAFPGITRGGHYHHTKTEKFLVVQGQALFRFRHVLTDQYHEIRTSGDQPEVVETIPGWTHDITNVGDDLLISLLWANELFDRDRPDTIAAELTV